MEIIGNFYESVVVKDVEGVFGGEHVAIKADEYKRGKDKALVLTAQGGEFEQREGSAFNSFQIEIFGRHKKDNIVLKRWGRKSQKRIDVANRVIADNIESVYKILVAAQKGEEIFTTIDNLFEDAIK